MFQKCYFSNKCLEFELVYKLVSIFSYIAEFILILILHKFLLKFSIWQGLWIFHRQMQIYISICNLSCQTHWYRNYFLSSGKGASISSFVSPSVCLSVGPYVCQSVCPSVKKTFTPWKWPFWAILRKWKLLRVMIGL